MIQIFENDSPGADLCASVEYAWALYTPREDGDFDLLATFPNTSDYSVECQAQDYQTESLAYHAAHELSALLSYNGDADTVLVTSKLDDAFNAEFPDVLEGGA